MPDRPDPADPWLGSRYPTLARLFGAYLHEDWRAEAETPLDQVRQFRVDDGPIAAQNAREDIERLVHDLDSENDLLVAIETIGSCYSPTLDRISARDWLTRVAETLVASG